jgi:DNA-binding GntR family transcriptional regulator
MATQTANRQRPLRSKRIERPKPLSELVFESLKQDIVNGEFELGEALSEVRIATQLDVSRTPVREAFARLELEGLVRTEPQRGTYVFTLEPDQLRDICDTRVYLETGALTAAFEKNKEALVQALSDIVQQMDKARSGQDDSLYLRLDTAFHQAIVDAAGNDFLNDAYQTIASKMAALRNRLGAHADHMAKSFVEHKRITELCGAGDLSGAIKVLVAHIGRKEGSYWNQ